MARCSDCKFWGKRDNPQESSEYLRLTGLRKCLRAEPLWDHTQYNDDLEHELKPASTALMFVQDGSGYYAALLTRAEFFCAHFEVRP